MMRAHGPKPPVQWDKSHQHLRKPAAGIVSPGLSVIVGQGLGLPPALPPQQSKKKSKKKKKGKKRASVQEDIAPFDDGLGLRAPRGVTCSCRGDIFFSDHHCIRHILPGQPLSEAAVLCGHMSESGFCDGTRADSRFHTPLGLAMSCSGDDLIVCDWGNHRIRQVSLTSGPGFGSTSTVL